MFTGVARHFDGAVDRGVCVQVLYGPATPARSKLVYPFTPRIVPLTDDTNKFWLFFGTNELGQ